MKKKYYCHPSTKYREEQKKDSQTMDISSSNLILEICSMLLHSPSFLKMSE
jgi:hypothetical protein